MLFGCRRTALNWEIFFGLIVVFVFFGFFNNLSIQICSLCHQHYLENVNHRKYEFIYNLLFDSLVKIENIYNSQQMFYIKIRYSAVNFNLIGCMPGYNGVNCSLSCPYPYYGVTCQRTCNCSRELCDVSTGCTSLNTGKIHKNIQNVEMSSEVRVRIYW